MMLQGAVDEQAGYGDDVTQMTQMISEAQLKLNAMPAPGSTTSLETLQHQLAEHRVSLGKGGCFPPDFLFCYFHMGGHFFSSSGERFGTAMLHTATRAKRSLFHTRWH